MDKLTTILIWLIAIEHIGFLVIEMFLWAWAAPRIFGPMSATDARVSKLLAGNMGLYNGFLAAGLVWGLKFAGPQPDAHIIGFFLACIVVAGVYGAYP